MKLAKCNNSNFRMSIPAVFVRELGWEAGDIIIPQLDEERGTIVLKKSKKAEVNGNAQEKE